MATLSAHSVNDVPTDDWTVEEVFQWSLLQSHQVTDQHFASLTADLQEQLQAAQNELWKTYEQAVTYNQQQQANNVDSKPNRENNQVPAAAAGSDSNNNKSATTTTTTTSAAAATTKKPTKSSSSLRVDILAGPYQGKTLELRPTPKTPCLVGRSRNKNFRTKGVSLPKDLEVSTTHGRFELVVHNKSNNKLCFTDLSSTNGTWVEGKELAPDEPLELVTGMEITCGQTVMKITLL